MFINVLKNESALTKSKAPEKRISLKEAIVFNCFYIMETVLASNFKISTENILRFYKTNTVGRSRRYFTEFFEVK